jgi:septum formation protein
VKLPPFILASTSPRRAELLSLLPLDFTVVASDATEVSAEHLTPLELCQLNAHRKARAVAKKHPDALVLGADTLVFLGNEIFGKPRNMADAERMLEKLEGKTHQVVTGVSLIHLRQYRERIFAVSTDVLFHALNPGQIKNYLKKINPLDKAGAYAIQERGELIVAEVAGSFSNVVGLPGTVGNRVAVVGEVLKSFKYQHPSFRRRQGYGGQTREIPIEFAARAERRALPPLVGVESRTQKMFEPSWRC